MSRKQYSYIITCIVLLMEMSWIGAKYLIEGDVVHTWLDHLIALCGAVYVTRDCMQIRLRLLKNKEGRRSSEN